MNLQSDVPLMEHEISGSGEPLVLVPGGLTGWLSWIPHAEALAGSRRIIRVQLHTVALGLAGAPLPPDYSMEYEITSLGKTLDDLAIDQVDLAGWSYGGEVALSYAIRNPDRVRTLTLIEGGGMWIPGSQDHPPQKFLDDLKFFQTMAVDDVTETQLIQFMNVVGLLPDGMDPRTLPQWPIWYKHRQSLRSGDIPFRHKDRIELVRAFEKPVLLVKGEGSTPYFHDILDVLAEEFPDARVASFPGGHAPHIVSMQPFMERFTRFLSERN